MSAERLVLVVCGLCMAAVAPADDEEALPEAEFLEYLGMWEETDEDWQLLDDVQVAETDTLGEAAADGDALPENSDES